MKKLAFLVCLIIISAVFSGCSLSESPLDGLTEKYDKTPAATTMVDSDIRQNIVGKWRIAEGYFDRTLGMSVIKEEYDLNASGTWLSSATAIDSANSIEYCFVIEGEWQVSNKQLVVAGATQKTSSFCKAPGTEKEYQDKTVENIIETIIDINTTTMITVSPDSSSPRIYRRVVEDAENSPEESAD